MKAIRSAHVIVCQVIAHKGSLGKQSLVWDDLGAVQAVDVWQACNEVIPLLAVIVYRVQHFDPLTA